MNLGKLLFERLGVARWPRAKKIVIGIAAIITLFLLVVIASNRQTTQNPSLAKVTLMPNEARVKKELNYEFIKFDTMKIANFPPAEKSNLEPSGLEPMPLADKITQPKGQPTKLQRTIDEKISQVKSMLPQKSTSVSGSPSSQVNRNPNMIVTNNLASNDVAGTGPTASAFTGMQSALIKVVLPERTPVANGSLVEARVIRDAQWGNVYIPRRSKLIGVASLFSRRVHINFREIVIDNKTRSCGGQAYDIKRLQGIPYSPVSSETKRVLLEELRDAVVGIPVLGRAANRATYSYDYNQDVSELDEGLEFYVLIESIY